MKNERIRFTRLSAMGDVIHALPAVASLKHSFPRARISWVIKPRWAPLVEALADEVIPFERPAPGLRHAWRRLRREAFALVVDFQGLVQSALPARAGPGI